MLSGYRVIDLTDEKGAFCTKMMGDLGADVVKIEKPGGDPLRKRPPFFGDTPDPEKSLPWHALHNGKRGITMDIEREKGAKIMRRLVASADFLVSSLPAPEVRGKGLVYDDLSDINKRIVVTSITPFGLTGSWSDYRAGDLVVMATGGMMSMTGDPDGPPLRLNPDHAYYIASYKALVGTLIANYYRGISGEGQHVDSSIHDSVVREFYYPVPVYEFEGYVPKRVGDKGVRAGKIFRQRFRCKDGYVTWFFHGGRVGSSTNIAISQWADEESIPDTVNVTDWTKFDVWRASQEDLDAVMDRFATLIAKFSKKEIRDELVKRKIRAAVIDDIEDIAGNPQLQSKDFWVSLDHPRMERPLLYPGDLFYSSETKVRIRRRAPMIGEHNDEIYRNELGMTDEDMTELTKEGVI